MKTPLLPDESPVRSGPANLQRGIEAVGGHLYVTNRRLVFEPHRVNVRKQPAIVAVSEIASVEKRWTRIFNLIPLVPNSIGVKTTDGRQLGFVVSDRDAWIEALSRR